MPPSPTPPITPAQIVAYLHSLAQPVAAARDADVFLVSGELRGDCDDNVIAACSARPRKPNVILLLTTMGGKANTAYRIARCLQSNYQHVAILVAGYCKSAGTLLVLGAHELIMNEYAELGPLDVQVPKADEYQYASGLAAVQALTTLDPLARAAFWAGFWDLKKKDMTTKTAAEVACRLVGSLYSPVYAQVDPVRVAEMERALRVARDYGHRLLQKGGNAKPGTLEALVSGYPAHDFVIDRDEALTLFRNVSSPTQDERKLVEGLKFATRVPNEDSTLAFYLNQPDVPVPSQPSEVNADGQQPDHDGHSSQRPADPGNPRSTGDGDSSVDGAPVQPTPAVRRKRNGGGVSDASSGSPT